MINNRLYPWCLGILLVVMQQAPVVSASTESQPDVESRLEELEAKQFLNYFSFGGSLKNQYHNIINPGGQTLNVYRLITELDVNAEIHSRLKFYSRYQVAKYWNLVDDENRNDSTLSTEIYSASRTAGPQVQLDRAYLDYFFGGGGWLALSIGRLPTSGGPPLHYLDGLSRQSTYPLLSFNANLDGVALSALLGDRLPQDHQMTWRFLYTPFSHFDFNTSRYPQGLSSTATGTKGSTDGIYSLMGEYEIQDIGDSRTDWRSILMGTAYINGSFESNYYAALPHTTPAASKTPIVQFPDKMFDLYLITLDQELNNLFGMGLDLYFSYLLSIVNNKRLATITIPTAKTVGFNSDIVGRVTGHSFLVSLRQQLYWKSLNDPFLGAEYFRGGKRSLLVNRFGTTEEVTNFYSTLGDNYHLYWLQPLESNLSFRFGFRYQKQKYAFDAVNHHGIGGPLDAPESIRTYTINVLLSL